MEYEHLKSMVEEGLSIRKITKKEGKGYSTIRYWLAVHGLRTKPSKTENGKIEEGSKACSGCGEVKDIREFYNKHGMTGGDSRCKVCHNEAAIRRCRVNKLRAVELLGWECKACKGVFHPGVYDFHHPDPSVKENGVSSLLRGSWERVKEEVEKCVLLCPICHRMEHLEWDVHDYTNSPEVREGYKKIETKKHIYDSHKCNCGRNIHAGSKRCKFCHFKYSEKTKWPEAEELERMVRGSSMVKVAEILGVSDKSVSKRCKKLNIKV